jgi:hypothetical protein
VKLPVILNKQKCLFFKNVKQEGKKGPVWGLAAVGGGRNIRKECRRVSMEILYTHV